MEVMPVEGYNGSLSESVFDKVENVHEFIEKLVASGVDQLLANGKHPPVAILLDVKEDVLYVLELEPIMTHSTPKDAAPELIKFLANKMRAKAVGFVSEVWLAEASIEKLDALEGSLENLPGRREALMVHAAWENGEVENRITFIERDGEGKITSLPSDDHFTADAVLGGRFAFFSDAKATKPQ